MFRFKMEGKITSLFTKSSQGETFRERFFLFFKQDKQFRKENIKNVFVFSRFCTNNKEKLYNFEIKKTKQQVG